MIFTNVSIINAPWDINIPHWESKTLMILSCSVIPRPLAIISNSVAISINPISPLRADPTFITMGWNSFVWKLLGLIKRFRFDRHVVIFATYPSTSLIRQRSLGSLPYCSTPKRTGGLKNTKKKIRPHTPSTILAWCSTKSEASTGVCSTPLMPCFQVLGW